MALEANAYVSASAATDVVIPTLYNEELQQFQYEQELLRRFGTDVTSRILPRAGNSLYIYKGTEFSVSALTQGTDTPVSALDFNNVQLTVAEYGDAKQIPLDIIEDSFEFIVSDLAYGAASAMAENNDAVIMTALVATSTSDIYPISSGTTRYTSSTIVAAGVLDKEQINQAKKEMREDNRFLKACIVSPKQGKDLRDDADFLDASAFPAGTLSTGVIGKIYGCEIVEHNSIQTATENSVTVYQAVALGEDASGRQKPFVFGYKRMPTMEFDREYNRKRAVTFHYHYRFGAKIVWNEGVYVLKSA